MQRFSLFTKQLLLLFLGLSLHLSAFGQNNDLDVDVDVDFNEIPDSMVISKITTTDKEFNLLLTKRHLILTLGEGMRAEVDQELSDAVAELESEDDPLGITKLVAGAMQGVSATVSKVMDLKIKCDLDRIETIYVSGGELKFVYRKNVDPCFESKINGRWNSDDSSNKNDLFSRFDEEELKAFVKNYYQEIEV